MIGDILYNIFITPIEMVVEFIFTGMHSWLGHPAAAIVGVSLVINFLVLPLYNKSDALQEQERQKQKIMEPWLKHIRRTFKGDERYMMQQTYYRQMGYKPIHAIKGSLSLLLQIPFFMAAYNYLSSLKQLSGASLWLIEDLSQPDALITIGSLSINLLPILMTAINFVSGAIYTRGFPLKDKLQLYGMALVFLVLLYDSPSGLVFYWTLNNVFSLGKNLVLKVLPRRERVKRPDPRPLDKKLFIFGTLALALLMGAVIPANVISSSPTEFISYNYGPAWLIINNLSVAVGFFCLWLSIFYYLAGTRSRNIFTYVIWALVAVSYIDALFFGNDYGRISSDLVYEEFAAAGPDTIILNAVIVVPAAAALCFILYKWNSILKTLGVVLIAACVGLSAYQLAGIQSEVSELSNKDLSDNDLEGEQKTTEEVTPIISLSKTGKNVIVFMLDRAISCYVPEIMEEKPEVAEALAGFTYYPNTLTFSHNTNNSVPSIFGGYEYMPNHINERTAENLKDKHNEALSVLPVLFGENGAEVTLCDLPYGGNYNWYPDMDMLAAYINKKSPETDVSGYITEGTYASEYNEIYSEKYESSQQHNFLMYSIFRVCPVIYQSAVYDDGEYMSLNGKVNLNDRFFNAYSAMTKLSELTEVQESGDTLLLMQNSMAHEPVYLTVPDYEPSAELTGGVQVTKLPHYMVNMAAFMKLADWFNWMRENGVWDNTKIILVSDHGRDLGDLGDSGIEGLDIEYYNGLLMVKDFGTTEFTTSDEFMTIGDVATLATDDVIANPVNPYTGNPINSDAKTTEPMYVTATSNYSTYKVRGYRFDTSDAPWYSVTDNVFDPECWTLIEDPVAEGLETEETAKAE